jgi:RNA polymerase sigma-70 factor, ECF subfamily
MTLPMLTQTTYNQACYFDSFEPEQILQADLPSSPVDEWGRWASLVSRIRADDQIAGDDLYSILYRSIRPHMIRRLGITEADDCFHDTLLIVMGAIQIYSLRDPARLMGFVQTVAHRQIGIFVRAAVKRRRTNVDESFNLRSDSDPESELSRNEKKQIAQSMIDSLSRRHREIIIRFYFEEQPAAEICVAMGLTETQFRLLKWRAKAHLRMKCHNRFGKHA